MFKKGNFIITYSNLTCEVRTKSVTFNSIFDLIKLSRILKSFTVIFDSTSLGPNIQQLTNFIYYFLDDDSKALFKTKDLTFSDINRVFQKLTNIKYVEKEIKEKN